MRLVDERAVSPGDRALTLKETEKRYGIPHHRLRLWRSRRTIDFFKIGRAVFVSEKSLIAFLESHREPAIIQPNGDCEF